MPPPDVLHLTLNRLIQRCTTYFWQGAAVCYFLVHSRAEDKIEAELSKVKYQKPKTTVV